MKTLLLFFLLCLPAFAQNYAVFTNGPTKAYPIGAATTLPPPYNTNTNYTVMTAFELKLYAAPGAPKDKARNAAVLSTISDFKLALANWDTLSAANQKAVLKRLVQSLLWLIEEERIDLLN